MSPRRTDSTTELAQMVSESPELQQQLRTDPTGTLQRLAEPLQTDVWIYRTIVVLLGLTMLAVVAASTVLVLYDKNVPDVLVAIGTGVIGALAGLLAPSPASR